MRGPGACIQRRRWGLQAEGCGVRLGLLSHSSPHAVASGCTVGSRCRGRSQGPAGPCALPSRSYHGRVQRGGHRRIVDGSRVDPRGVLGGS
eukprot:249191-Prorocentrum_minimum.AAC.4